MQTSDYLLEDGDTRIKFYGGCGVPNCNECLPLFDLDNNEIPATTTVHAAYSYQAWAQAHRILRSNVRLLHTDGTSYTFQAVSEPRWPVALKHYTRQASEQRAAAVRAMMQGDLQVARTLAGVSSMLRTRASDAQTGHVSNPRTLLRRGL